MAGQQKADDDLWKAMAEKAEAEEAVSNGRWGRTAAKQEKRSGNGGETTAEGDDGNAEDAWCTHEPDAQDDWYGEDDWRDQRTVLEEEDFLEWLQKWHKGLYDSATGFFNWNPPGGMLDEVYGAFAREQANARALRKVMEEKQEGKPLEKWAEWISTHLSFFKREGLQKMPDDVRQAHEQGVFELRAERTNNEWGRRREKEDDKENRR